MSQRTIHPFSSRAQIVVLVIMLGGAALSLSILGGRWIDSVSNPIIRESGRYAAIGLIATASLIIPGLVRGMIGGHAAMDENGLFYPATLRPDPWLRWRDVSSVERFQLGTNSYVRIRRTNGWRVHIRLGDFEAPDEFMTDLLARWEHSRNQHS